MAYFPVNRILCMNTEAKLPFSNTSEENANRALNRQNKSKEKFFFKNLEKK